MAYLNEVNAGADAFLFGRLTYEIFAKSGGAFEDPSCSSHLHCLRSSEPSERT